MTKTTELQRVSTALERAWASLYAAFDAVHDMDVLPQDADEYVLLLICIKEMNNAVGHAKDKISSYGESDDGGPGGPRRDDLRAELTKELAQEQLRTREKARKAAKAKAPRRRKGRR